MKSTLATLALFTATSAAVSACKLPGCANIDAGSCGNACCSLTYKISGETTETVMNKIKELVESDGGPDGLYTPQMTAEGTLTFGDLRQFGAPVDFIGQVFHTTINGMYNDTINFTLEDMGDNTTNVKAFSISQIGGAYGDDGQNFWNIKQVFDNLSFENEVKFVHNDNSCPGPLGKLTEEKEEEEEKKPSLPFMTVDLQECPSNTEPCVYNSQGATECCTSGEMCITGVGCRC